MCAYSESEVGCFRSSKGFSQATPDLRSFSPPDFAPIRRHPQQPRGSKRMLAVCRAGSKVTEVLAQYAGLSHRPSITKSRFRSLTRYGRKSDFASMRLVKRDYFATQTTKVNSSF